MNGQNDLSYMASLYMALADQTRLRLLLQMYGGEVCVADFTNALGDSQPKISRHLAYLRNAGIVNTRREGKWIHYSIRWPDEEGGKAMLRAALQWLANGGTEATVPAVVVANQSVASDRQEYPIDIYAEADIEEVQSNERGSDTAHNELEEFLL
jgi:DNA-binding transcriptional ArsR family regulator